MTSKYTFTTYVDDRMHFELVLRPSASFVGVMSGSKSCGIGRVVNIRQTIPLYPANPTLQIPTVELSGTIVFWNLLAPVTTYDAGLLTAIDGNTLLDLDFL